MRPILYLDVDDTLVSYHASRVNPLPPGRLVFDGDVGGPPTDVLRVLTEANELCEIRWLTWWAPSGRMLPDQVDKLSRILGVPASLLTGHDNPRACVPHKTDGIDWQAHSEGRAWFWIEDWCDPDHELPVLIGRAAKSCYVKANTSEDPDALVRAWDHVRDLIAAAYPTHPDAPGGR